MNWYLINSDFRTGQYNMDFDFELARSCSLNDAYLRFYRWRPYCISLGANQNRKEVDIKKCELEGIDIVRRPTGGRAILHAEEITYSVVLPLSVGLSPREIYSKISVSLANGLELYDERLASIELEGAQPNFPMLLKKPSGMLCFASTAKSELKYSGKKVVGSAQRKLDKTVLQHGSILCGKYHRKLPEFLIADEDNKKVLSSELEEKTIEIETILNEPIDNKKLVDSLIKGFENEWQISFMESDKV